jgi:hypothetical protein
MDAMKVGNTERIRGEFALPDLALTVGRPPFKEGAKFCHKGGALGLAQTFGHPSVPSPTIVLGELFVPSHSSSRRRLFAVHRCQQVPRVGTSECGVAVAHWRDLL